MRVQVELALAGMRNDQEALTSLETEAARLALNGAEIDAAKQGRSFDAVTNLAVKFALALCSGNTDASANAAEKLAILGAPTIAQELRTLLGLALQ